MWRSAISSGMIACIGDDAVCCLSVLLQCVSEQQHEQWCDRLHAQRAACQCCCNAYQSSSASSDETELARTDYHLASQSETAQ